MSSLFNRFQGVIDRICALQVDAFKHYTDALSLTDLIFLWKAVGHEPLGRRFSEEIDPEVVSQVLECLPYSVKAESLKCMSNRQRRHVMQNWSRQKTLDECKRLDEWQRLMDTLWEGGIPDKRIMTGPLPDHYPRGMERCASCDKSYLYWESIIVLDCMRDSSCEACLQEDGICLDCDPGFG
jgi:hypothetical protein